MVDHQHDYRYGKCIFCSHEQPTISHKKVQEAFSWETYFAELRGRKAPTPVQEYLLPRIASLNWTNDTLVKDMKLFWMAANRLYKQHQSVFKDVVDWAVKNKVHPRAFAKVALKQCATNKVTK